MKILKIIISVLLCITLVACGTEKAKQSEENNLEYRGDFTLNYPLFDGEKVIENALVSRSLNSASRYWVQNALYIR